MPVSKGEIATPRKSEEQTSLASSSTASDAFSVYSEARRAKTATSSRDILVFLIAFRVLNALCIRTFFQPDEYFQSLEPAWSIAFGPSSGAWLTWEWEHHLRSTIHPYIFAAGYWVVGVAADFIKLKPEARAELLIVVPKVIQAHIAACGDYYTWKLGERVYGRRSLEALACLALTVFSPWQWFCSTRTLSNCLETTLTVVALTYWPWEWSLQPSSNKGDTVDSVRLKRDAEEINPDQPLRLRRCLTFAALACILRPTNILIWMFLTYFTLFRVSQYEKVFPLNWAQIPIMVTVTVPELLNATRRERRILLKEVLICGVGLLLVSICFDVSFYKQLVFPPFKFLYFNIAKSLAVFYGRNDWHYYLTQGYPLLLTTFLPFAVIGIYEAVTKKDEVVDDESNDEREDEIRLKPAIRYQLASISLIVPFILSFISHKEVRFIYPILPLLHVLASPSAAACIRPAVEPPIPSRRTTPASSPPASPQSSTSLRGMQVRGHRREQKNALSAYRPTILPIILLFNVLIAIFTTQQHQRGVISVMSFLRHEHETRYLTQPPELAHLSPADETMTVGFLMPCHSTPWRSHLVHGGIHAWALGCEPPVHIPAGPAREEYMDEADRFYDNPQHFLRHEVSLVEDSTMAGRQSSPLPWNGGLGRKMWPEYLVFFEASSTDIAVIARPLGYVPCWRGWNSWFHDDWRRKGDVIVWCRRKRVY